MYETLRVRQQDSIWFIQFYRPESNNTINAQFVTELSAVLDECEKLASVIVLEGLPEVFCFGADFTEIQAAAANHDEVAGDPRLLYDLWLKLTTGSYITISHVRGKVNAGGIGFVAASDIVLADESAQFSLSELLFGVFPACVMPFLIRRIGFQKAHYLTLMTQPIVAKEARDIGLVDACDTQSEALLRRHLLRLRPLSKTAVRRYKAYMGKLHNALIEARPLAVAANLEVFSDPANVAGIVRYVEKGIFPWET